MELGWAESAPRLRSRLPNLNLLPAELLPAPLPWLTAGLLLLAVGLLSMLWSLFYMRSYTDLEVAALQGRLDQAQGVARELGLPIQQIGPNGELILPSGTLEDWAEVRARQVDWSAVFNAVANGAGPNVQVTGLGQTGYTVSVAGEASSLADANAFLQRLRESGLFAELSMNVANQPDAVASPQPGSTPVGQPTAAPGQVVPPPFAKPDGGVPAPPATTAPPPQGAPPTAPAVVPPLVTPPGATNPQSPPLTQAPPQPTATLAPRTPLASPSAIATPATAAPPATAMPAFDFIVQSKRETVDPVAIGNNSAVRVRAIDATGQLIPGLRVRIESQGTPSWSAELPRPGDAQSNGTFEFPVGMGKFTVYMLNGSSERATDLFTGVQGQPGVHVWDITFRKTAAGTPLPNEVCQGCTPVPTNTPAPPTPTPLSPGRNVSSLACVTTSINDGGSPVRPESFEAADNNTDTFWDATARPVQQITFDFGRYPNRYWREGGWHDHPHACQVKDGRDRGAPHGRDEIDRMRNAVVEAIELVPWMTEKSKTTHEIATIYDSGSAQIEYTFADVDASDGVTLSARFTAVRTIQQLRIRTIRSNVNVGWREIRLFEPLPPPFGTWTPTATLTPTFGATSTGTPTPLASATIAIAAMSASSEQSTNPAGFANDNNPSTFWRPQVNVSSSYLEVRFASPQTLAGVRFTTAMGDSLATATATVGPATPSPTPQGAQYRINALRPALSSMSAGLDIRGALGLPTPITRGALDQDCFSKYMNADNATVQGFCSNLTNVTGIRIFVESIANLSFPPGVREVVAFPPAATATTGPTGTATLVPSLTPTPSARPGLRTMAVYAYNTSSSASLLRFDNPLLALLSWLSPGNAHAAPLEQGYPGPAPPKATAPRLATPAIIDKPQSSIPPAAFAPSPQPAPPKPTSNPPNIAPAPRELSQSGPPQGQQPGGPRGRVQFVIVAVVRPGGP